MGDGGQIADVTMTRSTEKTVVERHGGAPHAVAQAQPQLRGWLKVSLDVRVVEIAQGFFAVTPRLAPPARLPWRSDVPLLDVLI